MPKIQFMLQVKTKDFIKLIVKLGRGFGNSKPVKALKVHPLFLDPLSLSGPETDLFMLLMLNQENKNGAMKLAIILDLHLLSLLEN